MSDTVLEIKNLSKSFAKNTVLNGINLSIKKGSVMGLMGENGAGKSTMMKCLFGIYAKDEGQLSLLILRVLKRLSKMVLQWFIRN